MTQSKNQILHFVQDDKPARVILSAAKNLSRKNIIRYSYDPAKYATAGIAVLEFEIR